MKKVIIFLFLFLTPPAFGQIKNFFFIGQDRAQLHNRHLWKPDVFDGAQIAYSWRRLEPQKDVYDFKMIRDDLNFLKKQGKKLFIQFQDVSFYPQYNHAPKYLLEDPRYHGGANKQYEFKDNDESKAEAEGAGWVTRRWDTAVQQRMYLLFEALGKAFDGEIEGINTEETSVIFGNGALHPPDFSFPRYRDAFIENIVALKKAFPKSVVMVYANFMPGGYRMSEDTTLLRSVYEAAWKHQIAVGGPDLLPYKKGQMKNSYGLICESFGKVPTGVAVQDGTGKFINPKTQKSVTAAEIYDFAKNYLHLNYIFWGTEKPFFNTQTVPLLKDLKKY
jgi:hypothetical protein